MFDGIQVSESRHKSHYVRAYACGARTVKHFYGDGESWSVYAIVPRELIVKRRLKLRKHGVECSPLHAMGSDLLPCHYGGPGQPFTFEPFVAHKNRRFYVFVQSGGLDI